jgi:hypothetical protein
MTKIRRRRNFADYIQHKLSARMIRSYHPEYTRSRPISEVKLDWAGPVLWTEMTREAPVTNLLSGVFLFSLNDHH